MLSSSSLLIGPNKCNSSCDFVESEILFSDLLDIWKVAVVGVGDDITRENLQWYKW